VIPHFDAFNARVPSMLSRFLVPHDPAVTVVGVDEQTALVGGPHLWSVQGRGSGWILGSGDPSEVPAGSTLATPASGLQDREAPPPA